MIIEVERSGSVSEFQAIIGRMNENPQVRAILVLACDGNGFTPASVDDVLKGSDKPVFGGIFPQVISGHEQLETGCVIAGMAQEAEVQIIPGLSDESVDYERRLDEETLSIDPRTMFVFVDGFSKRIGTLIYDLFNVFGLEFNYIGGGAGSLSFEQKPCLFTNEGLIQDSAVLVRLPMESGVGVSHGWMEVDGPFKVTEAEGNVIKTLDWKPALDVYREVIEAHQQAPFTEDDFFATAKSYPFGINKLGTEKVVRDPIMVGEQGSLVCVGEIPGDSYVHILTGDVDSLVGAAERALTLSEESFSGTETTPDRTVLFIDCISRVLFLEDEFVRELKAVSITDVPLIGALTIGEIANSRKDFLEFYNKTSVVGVLEN